MKQYFSILAALLLCLSASSLTAQNVNIPDATFKNYLISSAVNTNFDTEIQVSEAQSYTGAINLFGLNITDLTGIESFANLIRLDCRAIGITTLDISTNIMLRELYCDANDLTSLDVSNNIDLIKFSCTLLKITELDLSNNVNLVEVDFRGDSSLITVNLKNGNNGAITSFQANSNPALTCIDVDDIAYSTANWTNIDAGASFTSTCFTNIRTTQNISNLQVYPNPTQNTLTVDLGKVHSTVNINISNAIGQRVQAANYTNSQILDLTLEGLAGWYFIQIETEKGSETIKVLKQ